MLLASTRASRATTTPGAGGRQTLIESAGQQVVGLGIAQQLAHPPGAGNLGVVVVHQAHWRALGLGALDAAAVGAPRVVENEDPRGTGGALQQGLDFGVVDRVDLVVVVEIGHRGLVADQLEALAVEGEVPRRGAGVAHRHGDIVVVAFAPEHAAAGRRVVRHRLDVEVDQVAQGRFNRGGFGLGLDVHDFFGAYNYLLTIWQ